MTKKFQIYRCEVCGNTVQVLLDSFGELICCHQPMKLLEIQHENNELGEKHAPKIEHRDGKKYVNVNTHPMTTEHYIQFIEGIDSKNNELHLKYFYPEETPEFDISYTSDNTSFIELCNLHGLWGDNKTK